jgi:hypothetical protein
MFCNRWAFSPDDVLTLVFQGVSIPRGGPPEVPARIRRDCRHVRFWRDGLCTGACLVPEIHPVEKPQGIGMGMGMALYT